MKVNREPTLPLHHPPPLFITTYPPPSPPLPTAPTRSREARQSPSKPSKPKPAAGPFQLRAQHSPIDTSAGKSNLFIPRLTPLLRIPPPAPYPNHRS